MTPRQAPQKRRSREPVKRLGIELNVDGLPLLLPPCLRNTTAERLKRGYVREFANRTARA